MPPLLDVCRLGDDDVIVSLKMPLRSTAATQVGARGLAERSREFFRIFGSLLNPEKEQILISKYLVWILQRRGTAFSLVHWGTANLRPSKTTPKPYNGGKSI